jgi:hypothetical protein
MIDVVTVVVAAANGLCEWEQQQLRSTSHKQESFHSIGFISRVE